ncbi:hypothetical protein VSDKYIMU_CDS0176 [Enterococcus phage VRE9_4]
MFVKCFILISNKKFLLFSLYSYYRVLRKACQAFSQFSFKKVTTL